MGEIKDMKIYTKKRIMAAIKEIAFLGLVGIELGVIFWLSGTGGI